MRIGIANAAPGALDALQRVLAGAHEVAWIARDGLEALRLCHEDRPELVLMDLDMPQADGVEATRRIMREAPCAILVVTARPQDSVGQVFRALGAGALDVTATPLACAEDGGAALLAKIRTIAKLIAGRPAEPAAAPGAVRHLVAVGASTGGPVALAKMLADWRPPPEVAVVVVQHIDANFAGQLANWLGKQLPAPVCTITDGAPLLGGAVQIAHTNDHLWLAHDHCLRYTIEPRHLVYRPSIDIFFQSVAAHWPGAATGVLLTGMGRDGAAGLLALRRAGKATIAQNEASSTVYGMPRAAAELGAAERILSLGNINALIRATL
ncbi:chemotaxis-specific protein-glutamate methyltransferase CheB [Massilia horti]|uniref:protein-glutamate methylesterase n=1 Tax=Massilia horti TaxID=2562153 RepID=A0A4Y9T3Z3_9BURK|nr:chemotaxis-specific protein-glutamate methyltransferase CheB [Massilia horti]TFW35001.1 chemotaxis-specific protein-glutamate methyltransferase CheB [Massilia horti]